MQPIFGHRTDALVYPSELEAIDAVLYEPKESELIARQVFNLKTDDPEWAEQIGYDTMSRMGTARFHNMLGGDIPFVEVDMVRRYQTVKSIIIGWRLTLPELRASRATGRDPDTHKASAARRFMAEQENTVTLTGNPATATHGGYEGLFNVTGRDQAAAVGNFATGNTVWGGATDIEGGIIIRHIRQGKETMHGRDGYEAQVLVLSKTNYERLVGTFMSNRYDTTVMSFLQQVGWFPGGIIASSTIPNDRFAVVDNRPEHMQLAIPMDLTRHEPYTDGPFSTVIPVEQRYGGLLVRFAPAISIITGIA